jgi:hypothetical protein
MATLEAAAAALVAAPEPGQLARVRGRIWVVADVARDSQAHVDGRVLQHLVSLISVEDDATGEEARGHLGDRARHGDHRARAAAGDLPRPA